MTHDVIDGYLVGGGAGYSFEGPASPGCMSDLAGCNGSYDGHEASHSLGASSDLINLTRSVEQGNLVLLLA